MAILGKIVKKAIRPIKCYCKTDQRESMRFMPDLDHLKNVRAFDRHGMLDLLEETPAMYKRVLEIPNLPKLDDYDAIKGVLFLGIGGSAISGGLLRDLAYSHAHVPIDVCRDSNLPGYVDTSTLCFAVSYSGNTEETLSCFLQAVRRKAQLIGISSGGLLQQLCRKFGVRHVQLPRDLVPRVALPYLLGIPLCILDRAEILPGANENLRKAAEALTRLRRDIAPPVPTSKNLAKHLAGELLGSFPMVFSRSALGQVAYRWKTQFNENSKVMSTSAVVPELCHNEVEAFRFLERRLTGSSSAIILREQNESAEIKVTFRALREKLEDPSIKVFDVTSRGSSLLERMLYLVYVGDFVSVYLAILSGVDPQPVSEIERLKALLRKTTTRLGRTRRRRD